MHTIQNCEICNNSEFYLYIKSEDFSVSQKEFKIVKCKNCNFIFTNPRPKDENLGKYYISEKMIPMIKQIIKDDTKRFIYLYISLDLERTIRG